MTTQKWGEYTPKSEDWQATILHSWASQTQLPIRLRRKEKSPQTRRLARTREGRYPQALSRSRETLYWVNDRTGLRIKAASHTLKSSQYKWKSFQVCKRVLGRLGRINPGVLRPEVYINVRPSLSKIIQYYENQVLGLFLKTWKLSMHIGFCNLNSISFIAVQGKGLEKDTVKTNSINS